MAHTTLSSGRKEFLITGITKTSGTRSTVTATSSVLAACGWCREGAESSLIGSPNTRNQGSLTTGLFSCAVPEDTPDEYFSRCRTADSLFARALLTNTWSVPLTQLTSYGN